MMILYGSTMSPFVRKVAAFAAEKGIDFELKAIGLGDPDPEFRAASPFGKMPALIDGDYRLADSSAIIHYLEAKYPEPELIPADPRAARPDHLVRRVRRHLAVRLRGEDVLQPRRRAALPGAGWRSRGCRRGRARRTAAAARLSGGRHSRQRLSGRRPADAGRHRGRRPVRQFRALRGRRSTRRAIPE